MPSDSIKSEVASRLGEEVLSLKPLQGGCSFPSWEVSTDGGTWFVKFNSNATDVFAKEASGLQELKLFYPHVPNVRFADEKTLVLDFIQSKPPGPSFWKSLAENLAEMHCHEGTGFGFEENNWIGQATQKNTGQSDSWADFFWNNRLLFKLEQIETKSERLLDSDKLDKLKVACFKLLEKRSLSPRPLHGDLWRGNILCSDSQTAYLIDPAFYYGDPEADLAMTECFGGFPQDFYTHYNRVNPLERGYQQRKHIYNLYHILNHCLIFGLSYKEPSLALIDQVIQLTE